MASASKKEKTERYDNILTLPSIVMNTNKSCEVKMTRK